MDNRDSDHTQPPRRQRGTQGEEIAARYLQQQGYRIAERNVHIGRVGEIDIVAWDGDVLVFVEVKLRRSLRYGEPEAAITWKKQQALRSAAQGYCFTRSIEGVECRFDVVAIAQRGTACDIRHFANALPYY